jgi:hypothetical protein
MTPGGVYDWGSALLIWFAMVMLVGCFVVWTLTGRFEAIFVTTFGGLLGGGLAVRGVSTLRGPIDQPDPTAAITEEGQEATR